MTMIDTILPRIRADQPYSDNLRKTVRSIAEVGDRLTAIKAKFSADTSLSEVGRRGNLANVVQKETAKELATVTRGVRKGLAHCANQKAALRPVDVDRTDPVGELRRQEVRAYLRSLPEAQRSGVAFEMATKDPNMAVAILDAPAALSGLAADRFAHLQQQHTQALFGDKLREIGAVESDYANAAAAAQIVRRQLQEASGKTPAGFEKLMEPLEQEADA